jgi:hypothetical protein
MFVEFRNEALTPAMRRLFGSGPVPEDDSSSWSEIAPRPVAGAEVCKIGGVHNVHTLGFGSGRIGAGLGRIAEVCGGVADIQGLEPGSSPTSGTAFPLVRGVFALMCVH